MKKEEIRALEEKYAKLECPIVSNNSANRWTDDVPMVVPEINADHIEIIPAQRKRLGTKRGFIAVKSNCSLQSYVPALHPLMKDFGVSKALVCTYQAISGAGKTFDRMPEIVDNVIPYIGGKSMLFNKLVGKRLSIVEDTPGVTRDRLYAECEWCGRKFDIVDTGGIEPTTDNEILLFMREQANIAINSADVIILVTDVRTGVTAADKDVANMLLRSKKPTVLAVNKMDSFL